MDPTQLAALLGIGTPGYQGQGQDELAQDPSAIPDPSLAPPASVPASLADPSVAAPPPTSVATPGISPGASIGLPSTGSVASGAKVSGYSATQHAQIMKNQPLLDRQNASDRADVSAEYAPLQARAADAEKNAESATDQETQAQVDKTIALGVGKRTIADAYAKHENETSAAYAQARTESEGIKAQYRSALADYNASHVDPSQLWENAGSTGRFGLMATAFAHDFLGAKGIKTSAMDTINQAIQRNIDTQLENIRHKRDVAQGFKELWDMQRAQSATDAEAKERMFGFHLQGLTNGIDADMAKYDSGLAKAKGSAAKAALQQALIKNDVDVQSHIDAAANARAAQRTAVYDAGLKYSVGMAEVNAKRDIASGKIKAPADPMDGVIVDNSKSGGGVVSWRFRPGVKEEQQAKVNEKVAATTTATRLLDEFQEMQRKAGATPDLLNDSRFQGEMRRKANALRNAWLAAALLDSTGKASNQGEVDRMKVEVPDETSLLNGSAVPVIAQTMRNKLEETNTLVHQFAVDIQPGDKAYGVHVGTEGLAKGEYEKAKILEDKGFGFNEQSKTDIATQALTRPDAMKDASPGLQDKLATAPNGKGYAWNPQKEYQEFLKDNPSQVKSVAGDYLNDKPDPASNKDSAAFDALAALRHEAEGGDDKAVEQLTKWATMGADDKQSPGKAPDGTDSNAADNQLKQAIAMWELSKLHLSPAPDINQFGDTNKLPGE